VRSFAQVWCTLHMGVGVVLDRFLDCARMCLACALDLMSPSVHSWHRQDSIDLASAQVEDELGSAEKAGAYAS
jgi:hypothetical protein